MIWMYHGQIYVNLHCEPYSVLMGTVKYTHSLALMVLFTQMLVLDAGRGKKIFNEKAHLVLSVLFSWSKLQSRTKATKRNLHFIPSPLSYRFKELLRIPFLPHANYTRLCTRIPIVGILIDVHCQSHNNYLNSQCGKNVKFLNDKANGLAYIYLKLSCDELNNLIVSLSDAYCMTNALESLFTCSWGLR